MKRYNEIDNYKEEFKNLKTSGMKSSAHTHSSDEFQNLLEFIKKLEKKDEKYVLNKEIIPVSSGLIILTIILMFVNVSNFIILSGTIMIYFGLISILLLFIRDYINISKEKFGISLIEFLKNKKTQLSKWKRQPRLYHLIYGLYIIGVLLLMAGNTHLVNTLNTKIVVIVYFAFIILLFILSGIYGEYLYRKRFKKHHQKIIADISVFLKQLESFDDNDKTSNE
jgi:hypothetical protein